jgi:high-affinity nickel-transport protein
MNEDMQSVNSGLMDSERKWSMRPLIHKAERQHRRLPGIRKIPLRAIAIILLIAFINMVVWIAAAIVLVRA